MKRKTKVIMLIIVLLLLLSFYLYYQNNYLEVTNYSLENEKIPSSFNDYKIAQISDFHNTKSKRLTNSLIRKLKQEQPNIIVITGDLIDAKKTDIEVATHFIEEISNIAPIYYVTGNHEVSTKDYEKLKENLISNNVTILENKSIFIKEKEEEINLLGIDDPSIIRDSFIDDSTITRTNLENISYDKEKYSILLSHRPELFDTYVQSNIDLILTGHAHGGQIRIPFIGGVIAPNQGIFPKYTSGVLKKDSTTMIISRGIGNSILPFRINNRPELVIITLKN
mgnify:CR=1 FL=1